MLAEKLHTIYSRNLLNSRMKDYYDMYIIYRLKKTCINITDFREACIRSFRHRHTEFDLDNIISLLVKIKKDENTKKQWLIYREKNEYAENIDFNNLIENVLELTTLLK